MSHSSSAQTELLWKSTRIHPLQTHHVRDGIPVYDARFVQVLKFHSPGLAAATDGTGSFHITVDGRSAYVARFGGAFGFYDGLAAVFDGSGWFHIHPSGEAAYQERYAWCGNYQEGRVPVRDSAGCYFHLDRMGQRAYAADQLYAGDYRDGIACVRRSDGQCMHIDLEGKPVHSFTHRELDVFHKGFARARDDRGWLHIRSDGTPAYDLRFAEVELFYNGQAYCREWSGRRVVISETGKVLHTVRDGDPGEAGRSGQVVVVAGNCKAGKTTLGRSLAGGLGFAFINIDDFRRDFSDGSPAGELRAWQRFLEAISAATGAVVEFSGSGHMAHLIKLELAVRRYLVLWLRATPDVCLGRAKFRVAQVPYPQFGVSVEDLIPELHERLEREMTQGEIWPLNRIRAVDASGSPESVLELGLEALAKEGG